MRVRVVLGVAALVVAAGSQVASVGHTTPGPRITASGTATATARQTLSGGLVTGASSHTHSRRAALPYLVERNDIDNSIARWDPCRTVRWQYNPAGAPRGALATLTAAFSRLSQATGLHFAYAGTTSQIPQDSWGDTATSTGDWPPLTIAWARPGTGPGRSNLLGHGVVGMGGYRSTGASYDNVHWSMHIATGFVVLDSALSRGFRSGFGTQPTTGALLMHELGHAVGLGHAGDPRQIMYPTEIPGRPSAWGTGDRAALRLVGATAGCITDQLPPVVSDLLG
jgi:hypothetical protein